MTAVVADVTRELLGQPSARVERGLPRQLAIAVTVVSALVFYALSTHLSFDPLYEQPQGGFAGRFFYAQALALVHGHLHVAPSQLPGECFVYHGRCYGYQGLTPSILRLPLVPLMHAVNRAFTPLYITLALTLAVGSALGIASHVVRDLPRTPRTTALMAAVAMSLGPASVLVLITRPAVYEEAIAWSVAFGLLAVYCFLRWWSTPERRWLILLAVSLALSTNARPTMLPLGVALGFGVMIRALCGGRDASRLRRALISGAIVAALPISTCLGVWWLKFDTPVPSIMLSQQIGGPTAAPWWVAIRRVDHNSLQGARFVPTSLVAYVRPDDVAFSSGFPFINFRFGPGAGIRFLGVPQGSYYVEPFSTISDDMPLVIVAVAAALLYMLRQARRRAIGVRRALAELLRSPITYSVLGVAASLVVLLANAFITFRYVADWFPLVVLGLPFALRVLAKPLAGLSRRGTIAVSCAVSALVAWSLLANLAFDYQYWWHTAI